MKAKPMTDRATYRPVFIAAVVASCLMVVLGTGYRVTAAWLATPVLAEPVSQEDLDRLPLEIDGWTGEDVPMDPNLIARTDTDAHVSRRYSRSGGFGSVSLWIASGVQARDLMPHRPEVCYTGSGHTLVDRRSVEVAVDSDTTVPCNLMQFTKGALGTTRTMVLYYYLVDGVYCRDVGEWRYRVFDRIGYVTQVQIVAVVTTPPGGDVVEREVRDFAAKSAEPIARLFADFEPKQGVD